MARPSRSPSYYAIRKTKMGKGNRRNLMLTGDMLRNFQVRTVSENKAKASNSTRKDRIKAWITQKIEPWVVFSPKNREAVQQTAQQVLAGDGAAPGDGAQPRR